VGGVCVRVTEWVWIVMFTSGVLKKIKPTADPVTICLYSDDATYAAYDADNRCVEGCIVEERSIIQVTADHDRHHLCRHKHEWS
jgi:hypothetical protein